MLSSDQIRQDFLDFFVTKGHTVVPSAPVIPHGDPTLLFTNAGMNQFKDVFLGQGKRDYTRAADTQKCIRVSGKHNDLEEVGRDGYHHTFFEMLGNWSFGDYYKREAIAWAWELLTEVWKLPKDRLYATVYEDDDEALEIWDEVTDIGRDRILRFGAKDNFWEMGDTGPCGPCSEIHFDRTPDKSGKALVNAGVPEVMEIWNLVFIQYNRRADGELLPLAQRHVDTGMGFERIVAVLQDCESNYSTDVFAPLIAAVVELAAETGTKEAAGIPHQVIADHIRTLVFALADGAIPSNLGRGYVLRRILRRAARFGRKLGLHDPFLYRLVPAVVERYRGIFPELLEQAPHVQRIVKAEETSFNRTLDRGIQLFDQVVQTLKPGDQIPGAIVFKLYDTYGFPLDMTSQMAEERGLEIDNSGYEAALEEQKSRSRAHARFKVSDSDEQEWTIPAATEPDVDAEAATDFLGYEQETAEARILRFRIREKDGKRSVQIILDRTPFYAESGGQVSDTGWIRGDGVLIRIDDVQKDQKQFVHLGELVEGEISAPAVTAEINRDRRQNIRRNHTATHLIQQALRDVLGDHVQQKGSMVAPDRLRFDFSHYEGVSPEQLREVEKQVNEQILRNLDLTISWHDLDEAKAMGATALFGETYGEIVRVVQVGEYSMELCGGTHCRATGDIGLCKIVGEGSISAGIRRIEAITGLTSLTEYQAREQLVNELAGGLRCTESELAERVDSLRQQLKQLQKENAELARRAAAAAAGDLLNETQEIGGIKLLAAAVEVRDLDTLKDLGRKLRDQLGSGIVLLGAAIGGKAMFTAMVSEDLVKRGGNAGKLIGPVARIAGGGGGGRPHVAQAGGRNPEKINEAIAIVPELVRDQFAS